MTSWQSLVSHPAQWEHSCFLREDLSAWRWLASSSPACLRDPLSFLLTKAFIHMISWKPAVGEEKSRRSNCLSQGIWSPNIWLSPTPLGQPTPGKSPLTLNGIYGFNFPLFYRLFHLLCEVLLVRDKLGCLETELCMERLLIFYVFINARKENVLLWVRWDGLCGQSFFNLKETPANFTYCSLRSLFLCFFY